MAQQETTESRETLLVGLFDLMDKCDNIKMLPAERREQIKEKYRQAPEDRIKTGILMLEEDIAKKKAQEEKAQELLKKNIEERKKLKEQEKKEKLESEMLAARLLKQIGKSKNSHSDLEPAVRKKKWWLILVLVLLLAALLFYFRVIR